MPNALRIRLLGPLLLRDEEDRAVHVGGRQLRVLLILLALDAGRVVPGGLDRVGRYRVISHAASMAGAAVRTRTATCQRTRRPVRVLTAPEG